jgi:hypothetical protein
MKKIFFIISLAFLSGCSHISINYDPVEYEHVITLSVIADDISNSCSDKNNLLYSLNSLYLNLRFLEKYSKYQNNNEELYNIIIKLKDSVDKFKKDVELSKSFNLEYCKLQGEFLTASIDRTIQAIAKRR